MNKNILVKFSLTLLAGVTAFVFGKSDTFQKSNNSHLLADSEPVTCKIKYVNVAFANGPYLLYAVQTENTDVLPSMYVWTIGDGVYDKAIGIQLPIYQEKTNINGKYYTTFIYDQISAKQMTDYIYAKAYVNDVESKILRYSVLEYAKATISKHNEDDSISILLNDMLEYGESSQKHFNYHLDRLPSDTYYSLKANNCLLEDGLDNGDYTYKESITLHSLDGSKVSWTKYENGLYTEVDSSSTYVISCMNHDAEITAHVLPVRFNFNYDNVKITKNGQPFEGKFIYVGTDIPYMCYENALAIGEDTYSFQANEYFVFDDFTVNEASSDPLVYDVNVNVHLPIADLLDSLEQSLIDKRESIFNFDYQTISGKIDEIKRNIDTLDDTTIVKIIDECYSLLDTAPDTYKPYEERVNSFFTYVQTNLYNVSSFYDRGYNLVQDCLNNLIMCVSTEAANTLINNLEEDLESLYVELSNFLTWREEYSKKASNARANAQEIVEGSDNDSTLKDEILQKIESYYNNFKENMDKASSYTDLKCAYDLFINQVNTLLNQYNLEEVK